MAEPEDLLIGMITPDPGNPVASIDTGRVTSLIDATHVMVDLGDKQVTAFLPESVSGFVAVDSQVKISHQQNTYVIDSILTGAAAQPSPIPVGMGGIWFTNTPPTNWLICNGGTFSAATYPELNTLLGGTTLPDFRDRMPIGQSASKAVRSTGGSATKTLSISEMPSHNHYVHHGYTTLLFPASGNVANISFPDTNGTFTSSEGGGNSFSIQNPYYTIYIIIKANSL